MLAHLFLLPLVAAQVVAPAKSASAVPFASLDEGMGASSADGSYSAGVHLLFQTRYEHVEADPGRQDGFRIVMARPALRGTFYRKWLKYFVQWELAGASSTLLDAELLAQPIPELGLKVGQFVTPFSREFLIPPGGLLFPDFAPSNILFRSNRDLGAMLTGQLFDEHLEYFAAALNGNGINRVSNDNAQLAFIGRVSVNAFGKNPYTENPQLGAEEPGLALAVNVASAEVEQTASAFDATTGATTTRRLGSGRSTKAGADLTFHTGPLSIQAEGYARLVQTRIGGGQTSARGGFAQAGLFVVGRSLELAVRGDVIDLDGARTGALDRRFDAALNYYVRADHLKLQLRYAWAESPSAVPPSPKGTSNTVTVQAQLWF